MPCIMLIYFSMKIDGVSCFVYVLNDHCHRVTTQLQLIKYYYYYYYYSVIYIIYVIEILHSVIFK
jgi:hypothetical protein